MQDLQVGQFYRHREGKQIARECTRLEKDSFGRGGKEKGPEDAMRGSREAWGLGMVWGVQPD